MNSLRVLIACEFSGTVRNAFLDRGHDAWSCDLLPADDGSNRHIRGDARELLHEGWDLLIVAHPPCTRLCNSGIGWLTHAPKGKTVDQVWRELDSAADLFSAFWNAPIDRIAIENPIMHRHARERIRGYEPPAQTVAPWQFGEPIQKKVSLWLKGLPELTPTTIVDLPEPKFCIRKTGPRAGKPYRYYFHQGKSGHDRSRFFPGIAAAMADQWGGFAMEAAA
ncbi:hypothetical protein [Agrobacterium tumefaciens]|uniref:DNA cytosine methyltransferase n=1 Tax=Agrobacterium tumefaciens TaxID=358 RepID=A0AA44FB65_AGRTU|nr:hypothetical protein [Agrobacterium tumefaciens]NSL23480.1 hypothetical protein [Agrobacterium tumefaciens]NTB88987.1 hypothetical protein [Agrobacterium tumefaciens]NTC19148.1 hypothetical protein [Agrobacterium tumefaciens]NTC31641.1 hypothetical protein [Agrobacterium tumefaciens]NTC56321.1 hypothetical protein [Agrobacterium tumefaciens]